MDDIKTKTPFWFRSATKLLSKLCGRSVYIGHTPPTPLAVVTVFWYLENGMRHFLFMRNNEENLRFPSTLGLKPGQDVASAAKMVTEKTCGTTFIKTLPQSALALENKPLNMIFGTTNPLTGQNEPLHAFVWSCQITAEQAALCVPESNEIDIFSIAEAGLNKEKIAPSHLQIIEALATHTWPQEHDMIGADLLDDFLAQTETAGRTIH